MTLYGDNHYALGLGFTAAGTATVTATSTTVAGTGTAFLTEFSAGDVIIINNESHLVSSVFNDTGLTVVTAFAASASGASIKGADLIDLQRFTILSAEGVLPPKGIFTPYSQPLDLSDGSLRGGGWATAEWQWGFLARPQRDLLHGAFFGSGTIPAFPVFSKRLYIRTSVNDASDQFRVFQGWGIWPQTENRQATRRIGFTLRFRALVPVT